MKIQFAQGIYIKRVLPRLESCKWQLDVLHKEYKIAKSRRAKNLGKKINKLVYEINSYYKKL